MGLTLHYKGIILEIVIWKITLPVTTVKTNLMKLNFHLLILFLPVKIHSKYSISHSKEAIKSSIKENQMKHIILYIL